MVILLLQSASHHHSRMRLYYSARNPATKDAPCCVDGRGGCVRVEAEPTGRAAAVPAHCRSSKGGGALEFELPKTAKQGFKTKMGAKTRVRCGLSMAYMAIQGTHEPAAARRSERLVAALAPPSVSARLVRCAGRFLANGSQPARRGTPMPGARKARTRRSHVVAAAHISQRCMRMASPRKVGRASAGFRRPSDGNAKSHESSIR